MHDSLIPDPTDLPMLQRMVERLRHLLPRVAELPRDLRPLSLSFREADGRGHRIVLTNLEALSRRADMVMVGFFGQRRSGVERQPLYGTDSELIDDLSGHPEIVSYSSLELPDGESGNLVLALGEDGLDRWQRSPRHSHVAHVLAPRHYASVRIHKGRLPGGLAACAEIELRATRRLNFMAA
jgi:hypothetical protein